MKLAKTEGGFEVTLDTETGIYQIIKDGAVVKETKSEKVATEFLDNGGEKEKKASNPKYKRVAILISEYGRPFQKAEATSLSEIERYTQRKSVWVMQNGARSKKSFFDCYLNTPENQAIIEKIKIANIEEARYQEIASQLRDTLVCLTEEMMQEDTL